MQRNTIAAIFLTLATAVQAQVYDSLTINNINASVTSQGGLFKRDTSFGEFRIKDAGNITAIFSAGLWISGKTTSTGEVQSATNTYYLINDPYGSSYEKNGFQPGPIADTTSYNSTNFLAKYNRVWKVTKIQIDSHRANFNQPGYIMPSAIADWPGNGDTTNGESWILAPYVDFNINGKYDPQNGDYPLIRGDEAVFAVFNSDIPTNTYPAPPNLKLEIHEMLYAYDTASEALNNTIFATYRIYNKGSQAWDSLVTSIWHDDDLGNPADDLSGSDSTLNLSYTYNGDGNDEGLNGFGQYPPEVGVKELNGGTAGVMAYFNTGSFSGPTAEADPDNSQEILYFQTERWKNRRPLIKENPSGLLSNNNGDGYSATLNGPVSHWIYNDGQNWYQAPASHADTRLLLNSASVTLNPGDDVSLDFAFIYARDSSQSNSFGSVLKLKGYASTVQDFFDQKDFSPLGQGVSLSEVAGPDWEMYPNPFSNYLYLKTNDVISKVDIYNLQGQKLLTTHPDESGRLDLSALNSGTYIIRIYSPGKSTAALVLKR